MKGYMGKVLVIDLSTRETVEEEIPDIVYKSLLSGLGLGAYMLYRHIPAGADPLGPDNMLGFVSGLLTGTHSFMTGRWMVVGKSPLTGGWGDANCGGTLSPAIKRCGYDGIFFTGISDKPVYVYVGTKGAEIRDASHVWGKDAIEAEKVLTEECRGKKTPRVAVIGTAGEKCSLISGISNDYGRLAARSGLGAVMGSKKLKALVLSGSKPVRYHSPERMKEISLAYAKAILESNVPDFLDTRVLEDVFSQASSAETVGPSDSFALGTGFLKKYGTPVVTSPLVVAGDSPVRNWTGSMDDFPSELYRRLNADEVIKREYRKYHCYACAVGCGGICDIKDISKGEFTHTHKPEYETLSVFGSLLLNADLETIFSINELLNRAGMDTISAGHCVAFAIDCFENGILSKDDVGGLDLKFGNTEAILALVTKMISREGIGDLLADGTKVAAGKIGKGAQEYAVHAGGQEPTAHDPRYAPGHAMGYSCDPAPGRHKHMMDKYDQLFLWEKVSWAPVSVQRPRMDDYRPSEENALKAVAASCYKMLVDGSGVCVFATEQGTRHYDLFELLEAATGWGKTPDEYMEIGRRIITLRQMFNIRHGINPVDFKMHKRLETPLTGGSTKGRGLDTESMMKYYWKGIGWDENTGIPSRRVVERLGIDRLVREVVK